MTDNILVKKEARFVIITLNRPDKLNALTASMIRDLEDVITSVQDDPDIRSVLLTGAGKAFCAGADIRETTYNPLNARTYLKRFNRLLKSLEMLPQPTIAVINGAAVAGGLELAMACTFRTAATDAQIGLPEVKLGLVTAAGSTYRLPRLVGFGKAMEMCLLGELMNGEEAADCGLVNWVMPKKDLYAKAKELAERLANNPPVAMSLMKDALCTTSAPHSDNANLLEILSASVNHYTEDKKEGLTAFFEKRKPKFKGQ